jgi:hypothetical protein
MLMAGMLDTVITHDDTKVHTTSALSEEVCPTMCPVHAVLKVLIDLSGRLI